MSKSCAPAPDTWGEPIEVRLGVKPTPSIGQEQHTVDKNGNERTVQIEGRHDPCIVPRLVPAVEAMGALIILDMWEIQDRLHGIETDAGKSEKGGANDSCSREREA